MKCFHDPCITYSVALENDASCVEALYNMGLCNKRLGFYEDALECFFKLQSIVRNHAQVMFQIANLYELMGDMSQAVEWYFQVEKFIRLCQENLFYYVICFSLSNR